MSWQASSQFERVQDVIRTAGRISDSWRQKIAQDAADKPVYLPWMPFPRAVFVSMLYEAVAEAPGSRFLAIGCGPGPELLVAWELFGLDAHGFDRVPEYVTAAAELGVDAMLSDAAAWPWYRDYDILWFNRPFRDPASEQSLEDKVWKDMAPGAVVMCANLEHPPPSSWLLILDDWEARRGIYMKPPVP